MTGGIFLNYNIFMKSRGSRCSDFCLYTEKNLIIEKLIITSHLVKKKKKQGEKMNAY